MSRRHGAHDTGSEKLSAHTAHQRRVGRMGINMSSRERRNTTAPPKPAA